MAAIASDRGGHEPVSEDGSTNSTAYHSNAQRPKLERGASAVEYALLASLIAIVIVVAVTAFGRKTNGLFQETCDSVASTRQHLLGTAGRFCIRVLAHHDGRPI